jgi:Tol biopolymer transport system component
MRRLIFIIVILSFASVCLIGCGSTSSKPPVVQTQTTTFAFMQGVAGQIQLYSPMIGKYVTTSGNVQFTAAAIIDKTNGQAVTGDFYSIIMSADGKKATVDLYGGLDRNSGQWDIWVANVDGSNMVQVTNDVNVNRTPQFSPDGTKVIFVSMRPAPGNNFSVVTRNIDGTGDWVMPLPTGFEGVWAPTYSPDGTKIAMELWGYDSGNNWYDGIWVINADGSNPQMLDNPATGSCICHDQTPSFSSDGSKITFSRHDWLTQQEDVYIMNADGTGVTKLTDSVGINFEPMVLNIAGIGERILFSSNRDNPSSPGGTGYELYSMKLNGTELTRLTDNALYDSFNFSFDGSGGSDSAAARHPH